MASVAYTLHNLISVPPKAELEISARHPEPKSRPRRSGADSLSGSCIQLSGQLESSRQAAEKARSDFERGITKPDEELSRAKRMKNLFLARMSHEFRTPLNAILGFADLLAEQAEGPLEAAYVDYVRHVSEGAHHLLALVNDILDLSRIEAGRMDLQHHEFSAADATADVLSVISPLAEAKSIELRNDVSCALVAHGDRTRFKQILYNLLSNAVKFTPVDGLVQISAEPDSDAICFCVADTGMGIPREHQSVIFEEFVQVAPSAEGMKEGAGLGLAITKRIVELHGGRIWVESVPKEGSHFFFTMPAAHGGNQCSKVLSNTAAKS